MKLDLAIKERKIFDVFSDFEEVKKYYGKEVYCADLIENFSNLKYHTNKKKFRNVFSTRMQTVFSWGSTV